MKETNLPYAFDLLFDIKTTDHLYYVLENETWNIEERKDIEELMIEYKIPFPLKYQKIIQETFPEIIWINLRGEYQIHKPPPEEIHKFQQMYKSFNRR